MWQTKHFKSEADAMKWIAKRDIQWTRIFVENQVFSIEWKPLKVIEFSEDDE
jgi:hypothetical protein